MNQRPREEARFFTFFTCLLLNLGLTFGSIFCQMCIRDRSKPVSRLYMGQVVSKSKWGSLFRSR